MDSEDHDDWVEKAHSLATVTNLVMVITRVLL